MKLLRSMAGCGLVVWFLCAAAWFPTARGGVEELRITEVNPATGQVEVTHTGPTRFTTTASLPFCHRLNYATVIPPNTTFEPGESKVFVVTSLHPTDSDLWLYRDFNFGSAASIVTGLKYGPAPNVGRTALRRRRDFGPVRTRLCPRRLPVSRCNCSPSKPRVPRTGSVARPISAASARWKSELLDSSTPVRRSFWNLSRLCQPAHIGWSRAPACRQAWPGGSPTRP